LLEEVVSLDSDNFIVVVIIATVVVVVVAAVVVVLIVVVGFTLPGLTFSLVTSNGQIDQCTCNRTNNCK
jgi:hypothetical protein